MSGKKQLRAHLAKATAQNEAMAAELYAIHDATGYEPQCFDGLADHTRLMLQGLRRTIEGQKELMRAAHLAKEVTDV